MRTPGAWPGGRLDAHRWQPVPAAVLSLAGASASAAGTTLTLTLPVTFTQAYTGTHQIALWAEDWTLAKTGWVDRSD